MPLSYQNGIRKGNGLYLRTEPPLIKLGRVTCICTFSRNKYLSHSVLPSFQGPPPHHHFHLLDYHWSRCSPNSFLPVKCQHCPTFVPPYLSFWPMQGNLYCEQKYFNQYTSHVLINKKSKCFAHNSFPLLFPTQKSCLLKIAFFHKTKTHEE